jgi:V/A-type H+-transporting ATPase subunit F
MKKIVFLTTCDARFGFSLAGIAHHVVEPAEAETELEALMSEPDNGLVIIDERLVRGTVEEKMRENEEAWQGILLVLPSPEKLAPEAEDYAARLIRRAIGYHVRLNV